MVYQLAKTNILLGGQQKLDIILDKTDEGNLCISEAHLTPISENVVFSYNQDKDLLNYKHKDNLKKLYDKTHARFYDDLITPRLDTNIPIYESGDVVNFENFDTQYTRGLSRIKYNRYNKQFQFFCPLWITSADDIDDLEFVVNIKSKQGKILVSSNLELNNNLNTEYTQKVYSYLKEYANDVKVNSNLLYFNFTDGDAYIRGLDISRGIYFVKDVSYVLSNLTAIERPLMEFDNMITRLYKESTMICPQLFNFNFIFNIDDVIPVTYISQFIEGEYIISVDVKSKSVEGEYFPCKDFYSNYDFIPTVNWNSNTKKYELTSDNNVLDYLSDNKYIDFVYKNKLVQNTIHWCLLDNDEYIFNLYRGFNTYVDQQYQNNYLYANTPDIWSQTYQDVNSTTWIKNNYYDNVVELSEDFINSRINTTRFKYVNNSCWGEGLNYINTDDVSSTYDVSLILINENPQSLMNTVFYEKYDYYIGNSSADTLGIYCDENQNTNISTIYFILNSNNTNALNYFVFRNILINNGFYEHYDLSSSSIDSIISTFLGDFIYKIKEPSFIYIGEKIVPYIADSPSMYVKQHTEEVDFYKEKDNLIYIRYDGNISPYFITVNWEVPQSTGDVDSNDIQLSPMINQNNINLSSIINQDITISSIDNNTNIIALNLSTPGSSRNFTCSACIMNDTEIIVDEETLPFSLVFEDWGNKSTYGGVFMVYLSTANAFSDILKNGGIAKTIISNGSISRTPYGYSGNPYPNNITTADNIMSSDIDKTSCSAVCDTYSSVPTPENPGKYIKISDQASGFLLSVNDYNISTEKDAYIVVESHGFLSSQQPYSPSLAESSNLFYFKKIKIKPSNCVSSIKTSDIIINSLSESSAEGSAIVEFGPNSALNPTLVDSSCVLDITANDPDVPTGLTLSYEVINNITYIKANISDPSISGEYPYTLTCTDKRGETTQTEFKVILNNEITPYITTASICSFSVDKIAVSQSKIGVFYTNFSFNVKNISVDNNIISFESTDIENQYNITGKNEGLTYIIFNLYVMENGEKTLKSFSFPIRVYNPKALYENYLYQVKLFNNINEIRNYNNLLYTKYLPNYPSIDYYALEKSEMDYVNYPVVHFEDSSADVFCGEMKWYNNNLFMYIHPSIEIIVTNIDELTEEIIYNEFKNYYNFTDENIAKYYYSLYDVKYKWEYTSLRPDPDTKNFKYDYKIIYTLK